MVNHVSLIYWVIETMCKNIEEAERYARKAHGMRARHRMAADWCAEMAKKHLEFNAQAPAMLHQLVQEVEQLNPEGELIAMLKTGVMEKEEHLLERTAEVRTMLEHKP